MWGTISRIKNQPGRLAHGRRVYRSCHEMKCNNELELVLGRNRIRNTKETRIAQSFAQHERSIQCAKLVSEHTNNPVWASTVLPSRR